MWTETKDGLYKQFVFRDFSEAWSFMEQVSVAANRLGHHPRWQNNWNVVEFWLSTHSSEQTITGQDWKLARAIDSITSKKQENTVEMNDDKKTTEITEIQLYADGGSRGNPGPSASGFVIMSMAGDILDRQGHFVGITTNNQAEYQALRLGLEAAHDNFRAGTVHVYMDSMLVINQMKRVYKVKNRDLWPIHDAIELLVKKFETVTFDHVPRELNKLADMEVNKALDAKLDMSRDDPTLSE